MPGLANAGKDRGGGQPTFSRPVELAARREYTAAMLRFHPGDLKRFAGLTLAARAVAEGFLSGVHRSPFKGLSVEFAEHRAYAPGDEIKRIDWRMWGRTDRLFVREFHEETNRRAWVVLDTSASMGYSGNASTPRLDYAKLLAASLAWLLLHQRDSVGLITHDTRVRSVLPTRTASRHLLRMLKILEETKPGGETSLGAVWQEVAARYTRTRAMIYLISDGLDRAEDLVRGLKQFRHRRHEVMFLQLLSPDELDFPFHGVARFRSIESPGHVVKVDAGRLQIQYRQRVAEHLAKLREACHALGVGYRLVRTDVPVPATIATLFDSAKVSP